MRKPTGEPNALICFYPRFSPRRPAAQKPNSPTPTPPPAPDAAKTTPGYPPPRSRSPAQTHKPHPPGPHAISGYPPGTSPAPHPATAAQSADSAAERESPPAGPDCAASDPRFPYTSLRRRRSRNSTAGCVPETARQYFEPGYSHSHPQSPAAGSTARAQSDPPAPPRATPHTEARSSPCLQAHSS